MSEVLPIGQTGTPSTTVPESPVTVKTASVPDSSTQKVALIEFKEKSPWLQPTTIICMAIVVMIAISLIIRAKELKKMGVNNNGTT